MNENKGDKLTLKLLEAIERQDDLTQRGLSQRLGIALGLTNSYLKRCARKGLIKIREVPPNRYLYYLTPKGFTEKTRLTSRYLNDSFDFYRQASASCCRLFEECNNKGWRKIVLCGMSELAEIAVIRAQDYPMKIVGVFDRQGSSSKFLNFAVHETMESLPRSDVFLLTDLKNPQVTYDTLVNDLDVTRVVVPDILGVRVFN